MSDEFAIQQVINTYSISATRGDLEAMTATYAPGGVWEVPGIGALCTGHDEILAAAKGIVGTIEYMVQMNAPALIKVDGERATAQSIIRECGKYAGRQTCLEVLGLYDDELVRTADGWRFVRRVFTVRGMHDYETDPPSMHG